MIESGAPLSMPGDDQDFEETVAITQLAGETPADFAERTLRRIASAQRSGRHFAAAELVVGSGHDQPTCAARRLLGLALAEHAGRWQSLSELVTVIARDAAQEVREQLVQLRDDLRRASRDKPLRVRFRWAETSRPTSGDGPGLSRTSGTTNAGRTKSGT
jgi:hypothetical protein